MQTGRSGIRNQAAQFLADDPQALRGTQAGPDTAWRSLSQGTSLGPFVLLTQKGERTTQGPMDSMRAFFRGHRKLAALLVTAALLLKLAVPAGFMVGTGANAITVEICHGISAPASASVAAIPVKHADQEPPGKSGKGECPYGALAMASLSGTDTVLLALALAFILALGFAPMRFALLHRAPFLLPPLRGPPTFV